ncbi:MAG: hypothetical protein HY010_13990 [Acidobacteria bacterium]|nr:hypothetical protein [Acidobacteriota bacterium]
MEASSPNRNWLYRTGILAVTLLVSIPMAAQGTIAQYGRRSSVSKGPRALGIIQLFPNGKAHLIPVAITVDGKFFDASSYKGSPVPMALDFGVVYEGFRTGVSQGVFTITQPGQAGHVWMAEGTWLAAGAKAPQKGMKYETPKIEDKDAPPRLQRGGAKPADPADKPAPPPAPKPQESAKSAEPPPFEDPNRPILRRGKPDPAARHELVKNFDEEAKANKDVLNIQIFPAISDAAGPDARPFNFDLRGGEEAGYRAKMLELASAELAKANAAPPEIPTAKSRKTANARKAVPTSFDDVHLRIFDLSNSNDPVLILSAKVRPPANPNIAPVDGEEITLVARPNLDGDLRRLFFAKTDAHHLEVTPRMELIDAVDADGDGRGELLFRRTFDTGSAYAIYRATADRLWPLYEATP